MDLSYRPDGKMLASGGMDHQVMIWDASSGECLQTLKGHDSAVFSVSFGPSGRLASGGDDQHLIVWNGNDGTLLKNYTCVYDYILSVAFHPSGKWVATGNEDRAVLLFDLERW